jgi:hypothetical protein
MKAERLAMTSLAATVLLSGSACSVGSRPEQQLYELHTNPALADSMEDIAVETAAALSLKISAARFQQEGGATSRNMELYGHGFSIFIMSAADNHCTVVGPEVKTTFSKGIYDVVVARTTLFPAKSRIRDFSAALKEIARHHGAMLTDKTKCPSGT